DLANALAGHAEALAQILEGLGAVLLEPLGHDVPAEVAEPLMDAPEGVAHVAVLLLAEGGGLGSREIALEPVEVGHFAVIVDQGVERQVALEDAVLGFAAPDGAADVLEVLLDVGPDPPDGVGRESRSLEGVEVLDGLEEPDVSLLDEVLEPRAALEVLPRDGDHEGQVVPHQELAGSLVALFDAQSQVVLGFAGERRKALQAVQVLGNALEFAWGSHGVPVLTLR